MDVTKSRDGHTEAPMVTSPTETKYEDSVSVPQSPEHTPSSTTVTKKETDIVDNGNVTKVAETPVLTSFEAQVNKNPQRM